MEIALILLTGAVAGLLGGLLGVGGGTIVVPAMVLVLEAQSVSPLVLIKIAIGTSLATIVVTNFSSALSHQRKAAVLWPMVLAMLPGILFGAVLGATIADFLSGQFLMVAFGIFLFLVAFKMSLSVKTKPGRDLPGRVGLSMVATGIGTISALMGVGGGLLTIPFFTYCRVPLKKAIGSGAALGLPIALTGAVGFVIAGWNEPDLPQNTFGYLYWPGFLGIVATSALLAPVGARLAHNTSDQLLKRIFSIVLMLLALRMLVRAIA